MENLLAIIQADQTLMTIIAVIVLFIVLKFIRKTFALVVSIVFTLWTLTKLWTFVQTII